MPPHSLGSGTISFGLVSIPVKLYTAASSASVSFNLLHAKCGSRIKQQTFCPACNEVTVERNELVRGYEFAKDQYVRFSDEELKSLEGESSKVIDIAEFVPLDQVDPIYFEKTYYLGPDKGGDKAYRLLAEPWPRPTASQWPASSCAARRASCSCGPPRTASCCTRCTSPTRCATSGRSTRASPPRSPSARASSPASSSTSSRTDEFKPEQYKDEYRERVLEMVNQKVEGKEITTAAAGGAPQPGHRPDGRAAGKPRQARRRRPAQAPREGGRQGSSRRRAPRPRAKGLRREEVASGSGGTRPGRRVRDSLTGTP